MIQFSLTVLNFCVLEYQFSGSCKIPAFYTTETNRLGQDLCKYMLRAVYVNRRHKTARPLTIVNKFLSLKRLQALARAQCTKLGQNTSERRLRWTHARSVTKGKSLENTRHGEVSLVNTLCYRFQTERCKPAHLRLPRLLVASVILVN